MSGKYLLRGGCVLTLGARTPNLPEGDLLIDDGRIVEVGQGLRSRSAEVIDATDTIVMPGFVDAHRHSWRSLFRNIDGLSGTGDPRTADLTPEDAYAAALVGLMGAVEAGITTVVDWIDPGSPELVAAILDAHRDAGVRTVAVLTSSLTEQEIRSAVGRGSALVTFAFGAESVEPAKASEEWSLAREMGLRIHHHVRLDPGGPGRVAELGRVGLLGEDVTLVHCSQIQDDDLSAIGSAGSSVVLTPAADMAGGMGPPPIQRLIDHGIRPGMGVDHEATAPGDMFAQMRATNSYQHASMFDIKLSGRAGVPQALTTRDVIKYSTADGAAAAGLSVSVGTLEPGKQADILVLRTDLPNIHPVNDPIGAVVWGMDTSNVSWVFVAGEPVLTDGTLVSGSETARALALSSQRRLVGTMVTRGHPG